MLRVEHPPNYLPERHYILDVLLREFLGLDYQAVVSDRSDFCLTWADDALHQQLIIEDVLFQTPESAWLTAASLPVQPLERWNLSGFSVRDRLIAAKLPVIYGRRLINGDFVEETETGIHLGADLFGSSFFMLTRYEEIANPAKDAHGRFPATSSLAFAESFLLRPIVNEYLEVLWWALQKLWPCLQRKPRTFQIRPTHDIDWPLCAFRRTVPQIVKSAVGDVVKRYSLKLAHKRMRSYWLGRQGRFDENLYNTFDRIMDFSEQIGWPSAFYMITDHTAGDIDGVYSIDDPWIRKLMRRIHQRGHEIGLHPSYGSLEKPGQIKREFQKLLQAVEEEGIRQAEFGGRQHYLRWENPLAWRAWEEAGLAYDSTLDQFGFRCGTCYAYPVFDLQAKQALGLRERPLILMEQTALSDSYLNLSRDETLRLARLLKQRCQSYNGEFTILWHNDMLIREPYFALYQAVLGGD